MPQVPVALRRERAARLRQAGEAQKRAFLAARLDQTEEVLMEAENLGHTAHGVPIRLDAPRGRLLRVRVSGSTAHHLLGEAA
jgi:threonylcarbamoyladenosine tRNA methylthiotransferase MtaB